MKRIALLFMLIASQTALAQSRLPFLTNDTKTLPAGKKEFSLALSSSSNSSSITFFIPNLDVVYGITNRWQIELQWSAGFYFLGAQDAIVGGNNATLATKFLLAGNPKDGVSISIAPQQNFPWAGTKDDARLNPRESITLLPFQITMRGSTGYVLVEAGLEKHSSSFNRKLMALAIGQYFTPEFEMMIEYYARIRDEVDTERNSIVNIGTRYDFNNDLQLHFAVGGTTAIFFGEESTYFSYLGLKWRWGGAQVAQSQPAVAPAQAVPQTQPTRPVVQPTQQKAQPQPPRTPQSVRPPVRRR